MSSSQLPFYGPHTEKKLQAIEAYLKAFLAALSKQNFETIYIDAFAGSGALPAGLGGELLAGTEDARTLVEGSALRAMKLDRKFSRYILIEKDRKKLEELEGRARSSISDAANVEFVKGDAGEELSKLCKHLAKANVRSVVFLDPFGSQIGWSTLEALAATEHVDLWYLFPAGLSVNRQISGRGRFTPEQERSLDFLFGPNDWRTKFVRIGTTQDLFGMVETREKSASIDDITRFMIECMGKIFKGDVRKEWLPLGRDGAHWYSLIFAMANPSKRAKQIGHDVAKHILKN